MDYRAELQVLLDDDTMSFHDWLSLYPIQECPSLIQEYKLFMQKFLIEEGDFETVQKLEEELNDFSDYMENLAIDVLAERQEKINQAEALIAKMKIMLDLAIRSESKEISVDKEMLDSLREIVKYLKTCGLYNEKDWEKLKHLINE